MSAALTAAALVIAISIGYRVFAPIPAVAATEMAVVYHDDWRDHLPSTRLLAGTRGAPVTLIEFTDLECPACASFEAVLNRVLDQFPGRIELRYAAYPLDRHRFALGAARVAECVAEGVGLFNWSHTVYSHQDSLGLISWGELARRAGIADTLQVARCAADPTGVPAIDAGIAFGRSVEIRATPTILINGWLLPGVPSHAELVEAVQLALDGKPLDAIVGSAPTVVRAAK